MIEPLHNSRDEFELWLSSMDDTIELFISRQSSHIQRDLDFSPMSLDIVESIILDSYSNTTAMLDLSQSYAVNELACYVGETFRKNLNWKWDLRTDDPAFVFYGIPILVNRDSSGDPECPLSLTTAAADRRKGHYLRTILHNIMKD
ncbi:hypothetical protein Spb1_21450 [Planctopirus ephydatiae]|uniref:Uncharacterized protein n=1 Tax=Planctopirus ephydatiae TaxID=2528019 RepID=A0A518GNQ4_9PLAN|nr:hypothetical protein [Planctopirus ephydatiae]QDV30217.1 hypothetical protein Spb1_21450 [Planctopirus ephydatiae]